MIIKRQIHLNKKSRHYLNELEKYEEVDTLPSVLYGRTIFHIYPKRDTLNRGISRGFEDAIESKVAIYNSQENKNTKYKSKRLHDEVASNAPVRIRIFKDLSTMLIIDVPIRVEFNQSINISEYESY